MRRLSEHFFGAMFDFGIFTQAGADSFKHMLLGAAAGIVAVGFATTRIYVAKYERLQAATSPEPYRGAVLGDDLFIIGLAMLLVAFVTLAISPTLFPDERDFRILGPLPVPRTVVFGAKLVALLLFMSVFVAVVHVALMPLMLLTSTNRFSEYAVLSRLTAWAIASAGASMLAVLAITGIVGVLVLALPMGRLHALTAIARSGMLAVLVFCLPAVFHLPGLGVSLATHAPWLALVPPAWFVGFERVLLGSADPWFLHLAGLGGAALIAATGVVAVPYTLLFRHFERFMIGSRRSSPHGPESNRATACPRAIPAFRAVYRFITTTISRSQLHQGVLVGISTCGAGAVINRLIGANLAGWLVTGGPLPSLLASAAIWAPFALMFACGLGVRAGLALPMEHRANWIFRLTEDDATRCEQLRAVDQLVTWYVVGLPAVATIPIQWMGFGPTAIVATTVSILLGLVFVHVLLFNLRRIPFTCSYLPGKRFLAHSLVLGMAGYLVFAFAGMRLVEAAVASPSQALVITAALSFVAYLLRRRRLASWGETPLLFEDEFPDEQLQLGL